MIYIYGLHVRINKDIGLLETRAGKWGAEFKPTSFLA